MTKSRLTREQIRLLNFVCNKLIPSLARRGGTSASDIESYLIEKLGSNVWPKLNTTLPYNVQVAYIRTSLSGYVRNYYRDIARQISLPRSYHDTYLAITSLLKKKPWLKDDIQAICTELCISETKYTESVLAYKMQIHRFEPYMARIQEQSHSNALFEALPMADRMLLDDVIASEGQLDFNQLSSEGRASLELLFGRCDDIAENNFAICEAA